MASNAFIKLSRSFFENPFWKEDRKFSKCEAWLDLIQTARIEQSGAIVNGKVIDLQRGQLCASIRFLAKRWSWGEQQVRTYLKNCKNLGMITQHQHNGETIVTLVKYRVFNDSQHSKEDETNTAITQRQHSDNTAITQSIRKKEYNNLIIKEERLLAIAELKFFDSEIDLAWSNLLQQKKWKNKPITAIEAAFKKLNQYTKNEILEAINQSVIGNYQGVFPKKTIEKNEGNKSNFEKRTEADRELNQWLGISSEPTRQD